MSETAIAFARSCSCGIETVIAFVGAKWVFLVQFSGAEVMVVSMVAVQGRAVVLSVSKSPRCRASCAKKFALRAHNGPKSAFSGVLGDFFAPTDPAPVLDAARRTSGWLRWGFCSIRSWLPACRRRVTPLMTPIPPCGGRAFVTWRTRVRDQSRCESRS